MYISQKKINILKVFVNEDNKIRYPLDHPTGYHGMSDSLVYLKLNLPWDGTLEKDLKKMEEMGLIERKIDRRESVDCPVPPIRIVEVTKRGVRLVKVDTIHSTALVCEFCECRLETVGYCMGCGKDVFGMWVIEVTEKLKVN